VIIVTNSQAAMLVIGGTGRQGAAAVHYLRQRGLPVRVLLHDQGAPVARALLQLGVTPVYSNLDDPAALRNALSHVETVLVFLDTSEAGPSVRLRRGKAIGEAARGTGVSHVVYSSATAADHHLAACDQSRAIEEYWRGLGLTVTTVRPATLMEEIPWFWLSRLGGRTELTAPYPPDTHLSWVSTEDAGALAALAAAAPRRFRGRSLRVAGDVATPDEVAALLAEVLDEPVGYAEVQVEGVFMDARAGERPLDIGWLRGLHPPLHTLRTWLERGGGLEWCRGARVDTAA
jgi:uncharacterized protein YbjT (DUF2867 family)